MVVYQKPFCLLLDFCFMHGFSILLYKVQIQITLPKTTVYPQRVNHPSSGTTALNENLSFPENLTRNMANYFEK